MWSSQDDVVLSAASYYIESKLNKTSVNYPKTYGDPPLFELAEGDAFSKNCGQVFITINHLLVFHCAFCDKRYGTLFNFLQHISVNHLHSQKERIESEICTVKENDTKEETPITELESEQDYKEFAIEVVVDPKPNKRMKKEPANNRKRTAKRGYKKEEESVQLEKLTEKEPGDIESERDHQDEASISSLKNIEPAMDSMDSHKPLAHKCDKCDKVFAKKISLSIHILSHSNVQNYKCTQCETTFKYKNNLRQHLLRHANGKKFSCKICDKRFFSNTEATTHERIHTGERPFVCFKCGKAFIHSGGLTNHLKRHNDIRAKKCDICEKRFFDNFQLKNHMAGHSSERPFVCTYCSASFARDKTLKQHMKLHINAKEYACNLCDKSFNQQPALFSHMNINHKVLEYNKIKSLE